MIGQRVKFKVPYYEGSKEYNSLTGRIIDKVKDQGSILSYAHGQEKWHIHVVDKYLIQVDVPLENNITNVHLVRPSDIQELYATF
jgi:hypothetical protein